MQCTRRRRQLVSVKAGLNGVAAVMELEVTQAKGHKTDRFLLAHITGEWVETEAEMETAKVLSEERRQWATFSYRFALNWDEEVQ